MLQTINNSSAASAASSSSGSGSASSSSAIDSTIFDSNSDDSTSNFTDSFHLLMQVNSCIFSTGERIDLYFSLYSTSLNSFISEPFVIELDAVKFEELRSNDALLRPFRTLYADVLSNFLQISNGSSDVWIVCQAYKRTTIPHVLQQEIKRPIAAAVMEITSSIIETLTNGDTYTTPNNLKMYTCKDEYFSTLHKRTYEYQHTIMFFVYLLDNNLLTMCLFLFVFSKQQFLLNRVVVVLQSYLPIIPMALSNWHLKTHRVSTLRFNSIVVNFMMF